MRICLVVHGFPPVERTGVENYTLGLARALVRARHRVEVFVPRREPLLADLALRREERGGFAVNWITHNHPAGSAREALLVPDLEGAFAAFLDRERPEVVHFQHLIKLGIGLVRVARERGLPTVYTAHDYYPICHRYTLLRPDLSRCEARGDSAACARCDLAVAHLNAQPGLGDYHAGVLREQLTSQAWSALQDVLAPSSAPQGEALAVYEQRAELDRLRAEAYRELDLVLAPSRHLIDELVRGGFARERIEYQPYGFDNADLAALAPVRVEPTRPVRFAFLGGMTKHKGVHVLLEAFARLSAGAELAVWGDSNDREYVSLLRKRCGEVGAQWRGPYERADLAGILAAVDVVVVPSIWVENYPLVIHEAHSARRAVIASRLGAIRESVHDGVDGLLFAPGDAADLARAMRRIIDEPGLLQALVRGIGPVKRMEDEARELAGRYAGLVDAKRAARAAGELPASLREALAAHEQLAAMPSRELFARVLAGLDELREAWAPELGAPASMELLALGLGEGSEAQDRLREARNEIAWLRTKKEELDEGREELMTMFEDLDKLLNDTRSGSQRQAEHLESAGAYVRKKEAEVSEAHERMRMLEGVIAEKNRYIGEVEGHLNEAARYIQHKDKEYLDLEEEFRRAGEFAREKERELLEAIEAARVREGRLQEVSALAQSREAELERAGETARTRDHELQRAGEVARAHEAELQRAGEAARARETELRAAEERQRALDRSARSASEVGLAALHAQERVLNRALRPILERLHALIDPRGALRLPAEGASFAELLQNVNQARDGLDVIAKELQWLRPMAPELDGYRARIDRIVRLYERNLLLRLALRPTALGRKLRKWREDHPAREASP